MLAAVSMEENQQPKDVCSMWPREGPVTGVRFSKAATQSLIRPRLSVTWTCSCQCSETLLWCAEDGTEWSNHGSTEVVKLFGPRDPSPRKPPTEREAADAEQPDRPHRRLSPSTYSLLFSFCTCTTLIVYIHTEFLSGRRIRGTRTPKRRPRPQDPWRAGRRVVPCGTAPRQTTWSRLARYE